MVTYLSFVKFILFSWTSLFFGYTFNEAYHTPACQVHSEDKLLLFSAFSARHCFGIWVSFISTSYVLGFSTSKGNSLCVSIFWRPHGNWLILYRLTKLYRPQLLAMIVQLHSTTRPTRPTSATKLPTPISTSTLPKCSPRNDSLLRTAPAMQHPVHVMTRCYGLATRSTPPG